MKTIAVLTALAAVATAVPALPGYNYGYRSAPYRLPSNVRREKKSTELLTNDGTIDSVLPQLDTTPEEEARTLSLKKPFLIKKKHGYPHYRDSNEEEAERASENAREKCAKEVKVKFCEGENLDGSTNQKRSADDNAQINGMDMKHSINMAREAVEQLQKATQFRKVEPGQDAELHKDIEVARQAIEHIQKNFGNLESMNLQATTLSEAEALKGTNKEKKRMAQWKEAIENIQKNAEIPNNIEDNFKTVDIPRTGAIAKESESIKEKQSSESKIVANIKIPVSSVAVEEKAVKHDSLDSKRNVEQINEMLPAASELKETKVPLEKTPVKVKEAALNLDEIKVNNENFVKEIHAENIKQGKSSEKDISLHAPVSALKDNSVHHEEFVKAAETELAVEPINLNLKTSGNVEDLAPASSAPVLRTVSLTNSNVHGVERQFANDEENKSLAKSTENISVNEKNIDMFPHKDGKTAVIDTTLLMKSDENNQENVLQAKESDFGHLSEQHLAVNQHDMLSNLRVPEENNMQQHLTGLNNHQLQQTVPQALPSFKSADHQIPSTGGKALGLNNLHQEVQSMRVPEASNMQHQLQESSDPRFQTQGKSWHADQMAPKSKIFEDAEAERTAQVGFQSGLSMGSSMLPHGQFMHTMHGSHMQPLHHHHHQQHMLNSGVGLTVGHGKSADVDSATAPSSQVNVIDDLTSKAALNHGGIMNWQQKEAARGAYGLGSYGAAAAAAAAAAAGSGASGLNIAAGVGSTGASALGVFPGASVGGCAIPLLLSCSPSVVPGTLAKSSAYAAPHAYRSAGDRFYNKRDTKKNTELTKIKRTPAKTIQKIAIETKL